MFEDADGDTLAVFSLGGRVGRADSFPVPELPPDVSRPTSPINIPARKVVAASASTGRKGRPGRPRLNSKPAAESIHHAVSAEQMHAVLEREIGEGPLQIKRSA